MRTILMAVVRRKFTVLAVVAAITVATATAALAGTGVGGVFNLGVTNTVNAITTLKGSVSGPSLRIDNDSANLAATALDLQVEPGKAPLKTNSGTKVTNLNADRLDDQDSDQLAPILRAQQDVNSSGVDVSGTQQINSVSINAPVSGVLMISGTAFVNSRETSPTNYILNPKLDGTSVTPAGWGAYFAANSSGNEGSRFELSYTVSQPVSAGTHTVAQELGGFLSTPAFFYNNNELSVMFVPGTRASVSSAITPAAAQENGLTPSGARK